MHGGVGPSMHDRPPEREGYRESVKYQKNRKEVALWGKKGEFYISERWRFEVQITL